LRTIDEWISKWDAKLRCPKPDLDI